MAPEITGQDPYEGPPQDCFALGAILFLLRYAKFAFNEAGDIFYKKLQKNPQRCMEQRELPVTDLDFLKLVRGLTKPDPARRYTLDKIFAHPYMKKDTASPEEVSKLFYQVMPEAKALNEDHYQAMQKARTSWAKVSGTHRGPEDEMASYAIPPEELLTWQEQAPSYKMYNATKADTDIPSRYQTGFFSESVAQHILCKLWELYKRYQTELKVPESQIGHPQLEND